MKTRTIKELLILLRDELPSRIEKEGCLCWAMRRMKDEGIISDIECEEMQNMIYDNRPDNDSFFFFWPLRELAPRMEFLNNLISEL